MRALLLLLIATMATFLVRAEGREFNSDYQTLMQSMNDDPIVIADDSPSKFKLYKLIVPSSPIVIGSLALYISSVERIDHSASESLVGSRTVSIDDYLQYSPIAIMWGLDATNGIEPRHQIKQQTTILALSAITSLALVRGTKEFVTRRRPDTSATNSFPSGHTATAFMGAEILHQEFGDYSPWISIAGYSIASATAFLRVYNERHYITDVIAGAGVGMLSTRVAYWVAPSINRWLWGSETGRENNPIVSSISPCSFGNGYGISLSVTF